ncbi:Rho GTPase [Balamuthia mandrillaris]
MNSKEEKRKAKGKAKAEAACGDVWEVLPWELSFKIWSDHLCPTDFYSLSLVCQSWHRLASRNDIWKQWYLLRFGKLKITKRGGTTKKEDVDYKELYRATLDLPVREIKVVVVGDERSFKTKLCQQMAFGMIHTGYLPTIFNTYMTTGVSSHRDRYRVYLWDTAGAEEHIRLLPLAYNAKDVILICYRAEEDGSEERVKEKWVSEVRRYMPDIPIIIVALSSKGSDDKPPQQFQTLGNIFPFVCNVVTGENIDHLLQIIVDTHAERWSQMYSVKKKSSKSRLQAILSKKLKLNPEDLPTGLADVKPEYEVTLADGDLHSLDFIADPTQCVADIVQPSLAYQQTALQYFEMQKHDVEKWKKTITAPEEIETQTIEYATLLCSFFQAIIIFSADGIVQMACKKLLKDKGKTVAWSKDLATTNLLIQLLSFLIEFDLSTAPLHLINALAAAISIGALDLLSQLCNDDGELPDSESLHHVLMHLSEPMPLFSKFTAGIDQRQQRTGVGPQHDDGEAVLMAAMANLCLAALHSPQTGATPQQRRRYCRAMTAAILYHNKCNRERNTFDMKRSPIQIVQCLAMLRRQRETKLLDLILSSIPRHQWQHLSFDLQTFLLHHKL